ncbi:frataxin family protein NDAI_0G00790 [Naumovozyma dairenensis CBS 421]|uniref:ferroxidase n=1 Tax=Naumovozyma dairenensis (strain ATCC 10597 / BCRC 20456 / CBS 421 / NBRC 0211 / NRRL Y-12639) TaxID=1071378 RepID=G0WDJ4_NAUDC|nr:hypothetical protein NDAI_0G00790 [Naumovozyma dairenensis CBS 421]CCD25855.2 hypothetical protein NDAI_0G00790 [Naumovozyma dairenensis CBS 421]
MLRRSLGTVNTMLIKRSLSSLIAKQVYCSRISTNAKSCMNKRNLINHNAKRFYAMGITTTKGEIIPDEILHLSMQTYHEQSDEFLENLMNIMETLSETYPENFGSEVEYSDGVFTMTVPRVGSYIINKQPSNKQIWVSSPISGPNRFDFYKNDWRSLRDGKLLTDLLNDEFKDIVPGAFEL